MKAKTLNGLGEDENCPMGASVGVSKRVDRLVHK